MDFQVVHHKRRHKRASKKTSVEQNNPQTAEPLTEEDRRRILLKIDEAKMELYSSDLYTSCKNLLAENLHINIDVKPTAENKSKGRPSDIKELVCYGIGNFSSCVIARYQLALFLLLKELFKLESECCWLYDPILTADEKAMAQGSNLTLIETNEEGKRGVHTRTLFFMPHCGKALYNNLLWKNWSKDQLKNIIIIGNSFSNIHDNLPRRVLSEQYPFILDILPYTQEVAMKNIFRFDDIFNDMALHVFSYEDMCSLPEGFWNNKMEPKYDDDVEIITQKT